VVDESTLRGALELTVDETNLTGVGRLERGKVRDCYVAATRRTIVVTDRISAFDRLIGTVPFKGQVLNGISAFWFDKTRDICANHLIELPDPVVSVVHECEPFKVEMVVRGYLTGSSPTSIWTHYDKGAREYCGHALPEGMRRHERLPQPLVTPTSKGEVGQHDELLTGAEVVGQGLASPDEFAQLSELSLKLFAFGRGLAAERGLILVDTKYEFGRLPDGRIAVIDEVHTPDSSRYWYADSYETAVDEGRDPRALDKEYVRRHLAQQGFKGEGRVPVLAEDVRMEASRRYIEIYEVVTGAAFEPNLEPPLERIARNLGM